MTNRDCNGDFMSSNMLSGVLRMPPELWSNDPLDIAQRHSRYKEAADELDRMRERERHCPTMDEAEKVALLRALQEIVCLVGLTYENSLRETVEAVSKLTTQHQVEADACLCTKLEDGADACPYWKAWGKCKKALEEIKK